MKQIYKPYTEWEDYKNGMYSEFDNNKKNALIKRAVKMLSNQDLFLETLEKVILEWEISSMNNLTNTSSNRRSWLGQAACSYKYQVPEKLTRIAWGLLSEEQQIEANKTADEIIRKYEDKNYRLYRCMGSPMLF